MSSFEPPTQTSSDSSAPAASVGSGSANLPSPGWYADPIVAGQWRWWDGRMWTQFAAAPTQRKPRLPRWLSVPVLICFPVVLILLVFAVITVPLAVLAGVVPLVIVWPVARWIDRVEPEPLGSRIHAVLWGATVAIVISAIVELVVSFRASEVVTAVVAAPLVEEAAKAFGIVWAVRRREVDGTTDGVVYAALVALGFAVVEDVGYFAAADGDSILLQVFVLRALLTPFAHPLFTMWTGLAIGRQVRRGQPLWPGALWGYALAVAGHMAWNGSLSLGGLEAFGVPESVRTAVLVTTIVLFVVLFMTVAVALRRSGRRERRRFTALAPAIAAQLGFPATDQQTLSSWSSILATRRSLPRSKRRWFDDYHAAVARLTMLTERSGTTDPAAEAVLVEQARAARQRLWPNPTQPG